MVISQSTIEKYVGVALEVTGLTPTILYNSEKHGYHFLCFGINNIYFANLTAYLGDFRWVDIDPSIVSTKLLENTVIGIPTGLLPLHLTGYCSELFQAIEKSIDYCFKTDEERYLFVILHEFGHYHDLMVNCKDKHIEYFIELDEQLELYAKSKKDHDSYRSLPKEKYADHYALTHLQEALNLLIKEEVK